MATEKTGAFGTYYAGSLTTEQQKANALYICKYLLAQEDPKWTLNAIAGLCGNIESECYFNPGTEEKLGSGFGLIQWTPGQIHKDWCSANGYSDATTMDANLAHIVAEVKSNSSWIIKPGYSESYKDFAESIKEPSYLGCCFAWNRERPAIVIWGFHREYRTSENYYNYCSKAKPTSACIGNCKAYKDCYRKCVNYNEAAVEAQVKKNQDEFNNTRGGQANKWYEYLVEATFEARLDENNTSVYKLPYYVSRQNGRGGLNYNTAIEDWPNAQAGWSAADRAAIIGTGTVLPNCTSWVWGRAYEIMGREPKTFSGDAGNWWNYFDKHKEEFESAGYVKSTTTPALGAIACWQDPKDRTSMGHVAIVEAIDKETGNISISESGYTTWSWRPSYFNVVKNVKPTDIYKDYEFVGYIQLPTIRSLLPSIESFKNISVETETATFEVGIKANGNLLDNVYYKLDTGVTGKLTVADGKNTFKVPNLVPNTTYYIRVVIKVGERFVESQELKFTTKQDYPDPVKGISISASKHNENSSFKVTVTAPGRWGYWQRIGNSYGYRVYIIDNGKLVSYEDDENAINDFNVIPHIGHEHNFQIGISSWVTDHRIADKEKQKIFALEGHSEFPIGSNSICLKEPSEVSEYCYLITKDSLLSDRKINRLQPYYIKGTDLKPLKIFKPDDFK